MTIFAAVIKFKHKIIKHMAITKNNNIDNVNAATLNRPWVLIEKIKPYLNDWRLNFALIVLLLVSAVSAVYFYSQYTVVKTNPQKIAQDEKAALVAQIGRLIVLPAEEPTVATVSNIEQLRNQPFFVNAKNGDKVLIYVNARKAVLYDPVSNKIVEATPINIGNPPAAPVK